MGRKKGGKNGDGDVKATKVAEKVLIEGKTVTQAAQEMGIHPNTASILLRRAMSMGEVQARVQRSKDRIFKMLSRCDDAFLRVLNYHHPDNFGNQVKVAQSIYRSTGVLADQPTITIVSPIKVEVENKVYTIESGNQNSTTQ